MIQGSRARGALEDWTKRPTLVLGVGNPMRGDDGIGPAVCARLAGPLVVDCGDAPERYLDLARDPRVARVLFVDAVDFGAAPGEIAFWAASDLAERFGTTHDSGLALLARYIETGCGKPVALLGVQPAATGFGASMSAAAQEAVATVGGWLRGIISAGKKARRDTMARGRSTQGEMEGVWTRS